MAQRTFRTLDSVRNRQDIVYTPSHQESEYDVSRVDFEARYSNDEILFKQAEFKGKSIIDDLNLTIYHHDSLLEEIRAIKSNYHGGLKGILKRLTSANHSSERIVIDLPCPDGSNIFSGTKEEHFENLEMKYENIRNELQGYFKWLSNDAERILKGHRNIICYPELDDLIEKYEEMGESIERKKQTSIMKIQEVEQRRKEIYNYLSRK